jgi:ASC-1-like (ASCH) protein
MFIHKLNISKKWLDEISFGKKTVEGRLIKGDKYEIMKIGDHIMFSCGEIKEKCTIIGLNKYDTFKEMIIYEGLINVLPTIKTLEEGLSFYDNIYYNTDDQKQDNAKYKILAIKIKTQN